MGICISKKCSYCKYNHHSSPRKFIVKEELSDEYSYMVQKDCIQCLCDDCEEVIYRYSEIDISNKIR